jgi:hypothetical protein
MGARRRFGGPAGLVFMVLAGHLTVREGSASTILPMSIRELATQADLIFAGTVRSLEYTKISDVGLVTRVTFGEVEYVTGPPAGRAVLTLRGGRSGKGVSFVEGLPPFKKGSRYVIFAADWGNSQNGYLPILGLHQGAFRIAKEGETRVIRDSANRILTDANDGLLGVVDSTFLAGFKTKDTAKKGRFEQPDGQNSGIPGAVPGGRIVESSETYLPDSMFVTPHIARAPDGSPELRIYPPKADPGTRMTEKDFLAFIRRVRGN